MFARENDAKIVSFDLVLMSQNYWLSSRYINICQITIKSGLAVPLL